MVDAKAWRSTAVRIGFVPEPGDVVIVSGTWDFYAPTGREFDRGSNETC